jgi:hypothetical protein
MDDESLSTLSCWICSAKFYGNTVVTTTVTILAKKGTTTATKSTSVQNVTNLPEKKLLLKSFVKLFPVYSPLWLV